MAESCALKRKKTKISRRETISGGDVLSVDDLIAKYVTPADVAERDFSLSAKKWEGVKILKERNFSRTGFAPVYKIVGGKKYCK